MVAPTPSRREWLWLLGAATAVRVGLSFGLFGTMPLFSDGAEYSRQAVRFATGIPDEAGYYWPPGTSYLLAAAYWAVGVHAWVTRATTIVVSVLCVLFATLLARRVLSDRRAVLASGWILALYPPVLMDVAQPYSLDLAMLGLLVFAWSALGAWDTGRLPWFVLGGVALGVATLSRPSSLSVALGLLVALVVALRRQGSEGRRPTRWSLAAGAAVFAMATAATVFPALHHNHAVGQGWTLSVNNEQNVWFGNNPYTPNYLTSRLGQHQPSFFEPEVRRYLERFDFTGVPGPALRRRYRAAALGYVREHPGVTALRTANRARAFWGFDYTLSHDWGTFWHKGPAWVGSGLLLEAGGYCLVMLLAILGLTCGRDLLRRGRGAFLLALVAAYELPYLLAFSGGKWHYPVMGLLVPFAGAGAAWLASARAAWGPVRRTRWMWVGAATFLVVQLEYGLLVLRAQ